MGGIGIDPKNILVRGHHLSSSLDCVSAASGHDLVGDGSSGTVNGYCGSVGLQRHWPPQESVLRIRRNIHDVIRLASTRLFHLKRSSSH